MRARKRKKSRLLRLEAISLLVVVVAAFVLPAVGATSTAGAAAGFARGWSWLQENCASERWCAGAVDAAKHAGKAAQDAAAKAVLSAADGVAAVLSTEVRLPTQKVGSFLDGLSSALMPTSSACRGKFSVDAVGRLRRLMELRIAAQDKAMESLVSTFEAWHWSRLQDSVERRPLVLALSGPTGVGKTETAFTVAEALLCEGGEGSQVGSSGHSSGFRFFGFSSRPACSSSKPPPAFLVIDGEDFAGHGGHGGEMESPYTVGDKRNKKGHDDHDDAVDGSADPTERLRQALRLRVARHIRDCGGTAVVLIDEVQKIAPGVLGVLAGAFGLRGTATVSAVEKISVKTYSWGEGGNGGGDDGDVDDDDNNGNGKSNGKEEQEEREVHPDGSTASSSSFGSIPSLSRSERVEYRTVSVPTRDVVFVLVSDVGAEGMRAILEEQVKKEREKRRKGREGKRKGGEERSAKERGRRDKREHSPPPLPWAAIRSSVRSALDAQWQRLGLGGAVNRVVPFLPLRARSVSRVVELKLRAAARASEGLFWECPRGQHGPSPSSSFSSSEPPCEHGLSWDAALPGVLARSEFIDYDVSEGIRDDEGSTGGVAFARYGARGVVVGGPLQLLQAKLYRYLYESGHGSGSVGTGIPGARPGTVHVGVHRAAEHGISSGGGVARIELSLRRCRERAGCEELWRGELRE